MLHQPSSLPLIDADLQGGTDTGSDVYAGAPWAFMQIAAHAVRAILNHPFLHLVNTHDNSRITKPMAYLQQTVDAALYNSSWVARLLRIFDSLPFEMIDPLLGHLVAGTATVLWFFQFTRDSKISLRAKEDLDKCERFLERLSTIWPHLVQKVYLLSPPLLACPSSS